MFKMMRAGCGSLQSQLLLLPNWPEIVARTFRSKECLSLLQSKSKHGISGCQVSADPSNARTQCQSQSELPQEGFACVCWHLSQPARGHGLPGDALWKYVTHILAGNNVSNAWPVAFLEHTRKLWKAFHVLKNINDLRLLEMNVNSDDPAVVMCGSSQCCVFIYQEKWLCSGGLISAVHIRLLPWEIC